MLRSSHAAHTMMKNMRRLVKLKTLFVNTMRRRQGNGYSKAECADIYANAHGGKHFQVGAKVLMV